MAADNSSEDVKTLRSDIEALRNDLAAVTKSLGEVAKNRAEGMREAAWTQAGHVRDDVGHMVEDISNRGRRQVDRLEQEVAERPIFSILTAFGIGLLIGKLLDRR